MTSKSTTTSTTNDDANQEVTIPLEGIDFEKEVRSIISIY